MNEGFFFPFSITRYFQGLNRVTRADRMSSVCSPVFVRCIYFLVSVRSAVRNSTLLVDATELKGRPGAAHSLNAEEEVIKILGGPRTAHLPALPKCESRISSGPERCLVRS